LTSINFLMGDLRVDAMRLEIEFALCFSG